MSTHVIPLFWSALEASVLMIETAWSLGYPQVTIQTGESDESALLRGCRDLLGVAPVSYLPLREYPNHWLNGLDPRLPSGAEPWLITNWHGHLAGETRQGQVLVWRQPAQALAQDETTAEAELVTRSIVSRLFGRL
jgi:hypothetical protein